MNEINLLGLFLISLFSLGFILALASLALGYFLILVGLIIVVRIFNEPYKEVPALDLIPKKNIS